MTKLDNLGKSAMSITVIDPPVGGKNQGTVGIVADPFADHGERFANEMGRSGFIGVPPIDPQIQGNGNPVEELQQSGDE